MAKLVENSAGAYSVDHPWTCWFLGLEKDWNQPAGIRGMGRMRGWMLPLLIILITEYLFVLVDPLIRSSQGLSSWCFLLEAACSYGGVDVFPVGYLWSDIVVSVDAGSRFFARWWIYKCMREGPCNRVCVKEIGEGMFGECLSCRLDLPSLHWTCWKKDYLLPVVPLGEQPHSPFQMLNGRVNSVKSSPTMAEGVPDKKDHEIIELLLM